MRVLVTGAGGFVGRHLVNLLRERGDEFLATSARGIANESILAMDVTNQDEVGKVVDDFRPEGIIHLAARASVQDSWRDPDSTFKVNVIGASNVLESVRELQSARVLLIGSAQQYAGGIEGSFKESDPLKPRSPYAISKIAQEMLGRLYFEEFRLPVVMTRSFNHTGPGQAKEYAVGSFAAQIAAFDSARDRKFYVGSLESVRDFLDVRDVVRAYLSLLEKGIPGEVYNVCSGIGVRIGSLLEKMIEIAGLESEIDIVEDNSRRGDPDWLVGDNSKIRALGWQQGISLEDSLAGVIDWQRKGRDA